MEDYDSNTTLETIARQLTDAASVMVTTHAKPDGDALGSVLALSRALQQRHVQVHPLFVPPVRDSFDGIQGREMASIYRPETTLAETSWTVILDTGAWSQVESIGEAIRPRLAHTIIIDHHLHGDIPAAYRFVDSTSASCAEVVAALIDCMPNPTTEDPLADPVIAENLFVGIAADTGWFRFSNTTARTHELAARLLRAGIDHADIYARLEQSERLEKLQLLTRALDSLRLVADDRAAIMVLRKEDFQATGARAEETEQIVDLPRAVSTVQVVALISEPPPDSNGGPNGIRISFRSKSGHQALNVSTLATRFGGGGHARAAGARSDQPLDDVVKAVTDAIVGELGQADTSSPLGGGGYPDASSSIVLMPW